MPSRIVCFVCGSLGGEYQLHSKPHEGQAYFPFLEHHDPPKGSRTPGPDGIVDSCRVCYAFLTQQWDTYERTNTPALKRLYWLKRLDDGQFTGAEMKLQGEYMAQVMGLQYQPSCADGCAPLSPDSRDEFSSGHRESDYTLGRKQEADDGALDLTVPVKTESSLKSNKPGREKSEVSTSRASPEHLCFICYTCGKESQEISVKLISSIYHVANKPYFPFLTKLAPPRGATPLNEQGVCQVCDHCFSSLCHQWITYEQQGTPNGARIFKVNGVFFSNDSSIVAGREVKSNHKEVCYLCSQSWPSTKMCPLYTAPISGKKDHMYFPFIRELRRPHGAHPLNPDGSVQVCISCYGNLQFQWRHYEAEKVPYLHRRYSLLPPSTSTVPVLHMTLDADVKLKNHGIEPSGISSTPDSRKSPGLIKNSSNSSATINSFLNNEPVKPYNNEIKLPPTNSVLSIPHPLQQAGERPKKVCFICGEKCLVTKAQLLHTYPLRQDTKPFGGPTDAFFPFLASYDPPPGSDPPTEEGIVISCSYCYYSLLNQWKDYEEFKMPADIDRFKRKYKLHEFVCFVCGMMIPRKKLRTLEVQKFLFLREHKAPPNALVMWGGQAVGACSSCHFSLTHQYTEFERLGLPLELRKYNWTVQHHSEETKDARSNHHGQEVVSATSEESSISEGPESYPGLSTTSGRLTLNTSGSSSVRMPSMAAAPPSSTFHSPNNSNAPGLSSFSAALRKLAYQTKDSPDDSHAKHSMSPSSHNSSRSTTPKRAHSLAFSSKSNNVTQSHQSQNSAETHRQSVERSMTTDMTSPLEYGSKSSLDQLGRLGSRDFTQGREHRDDPRGRDHRGTPRDSRGSKDAERDPQHLAATHTRSGSELFGREFPGYLTEEEAASMGLAIPLRIDPAAYMAAYHPFYLQQQAMAAQNPFRLDDQLLMEQYRMFHPSFLPFPGAAYLPGHQRQVDMHSMLAAAQHYPLELLQQHYAFMNSSHPLLTPRFAAQSVLSDRRLDEEKARLLAERSKEHDRLLEWEVKHEPRLSPERDYKKLNSSEHFAQDKNSKEKHDCLPRQLDTGSSGHPGREVGSGQGVSASSVSEKKGHGRAVQSAAEFKQGTTKTDTKESSFEKPVHNLSLFPHNIVQSHSVPLSHEDYMKLHSSKNTDYRALVSESHSPSKISKMASGILALDGSASLQNLPDHGLKTLPAAQPQPAYTALGLSNHIKTPRSNSSSSKTLFRPFDDTKTTCESPSDTKPVVQDSQELSHHLVSGCPSTGSLSLGLPVFSHKPAASESHPAILSIPTVKPFTKSSQTITDSTASFEVSGKLNPSSFSNTLPSQNRLDPLSSYVRDKVERFDFKSLARECSSSSTKSNPIGGAPEEPHSQEASTTQRALLSKLDHELERLRKLDKVSSSDIEDDSEERKLIRLTMVERATPIPLDVPQAKLELFNYLGLTTWSNKKELQLAKEIRRRQQFGLSSVSPIQCEVESTPEFTSFGSHFGHGPLHGSRKFSSTLTQEPASCFEKSKFLCDLGLHPFGENDHPGTSDVKPYQWPGVETVIGSYHKHNEEQLQESHLLYDRYRQLQVENERLVQVSETYNRNMAMLLMNQQELEQTRAHYLFAIDFLKQSTLTLKQKLLSQDIERKTKFP